MTKIGYEFLIKRLEGVLVEPPENYTADQLTAWLQGYTACGKATRNVINEVMSEQG